MHLCHSLRKLELALHDFGVYEVCLLVLRHSFPHQIEMRLNQGFVDKVQRCWMGEQVA